MAVKFSRKIVVSVTGVVLAIGLVVVGYMRYLKPRVTEWREARTEIAKREKKLDNLRDAFANQKNPQDELKVLEQEIVNLKEANKALEKVKTVGVETSDLPKELQDPDREIRRELYRDYMKQVMDVAEDRIKGKLRSANIPPPEIRLYTELENADEAAYYLNRAGGLQGLVDAMTKVPADGGSIIFDKLFLEDYKEGIKHRSGAVNILRYAVKMTVDTQSLLSFLYHLQEEDSYYFIEDMTIQPRTSIRGAGPQQLNVEATINTTMVFKSQVEAQVKAAAAAAGVKVGQSRQGGGGWLGLALGMQKQLEKEAEQDKQKKWYQFWKWFR